MSLKDVGDAAQLLGSIFSTLLIVLGGVWYLVRRARQFFENLDGSLGTLKQGQSDTNTHLARLNGSVARHEKDIGYIKERLGALEGATFHRPPLLDEELGQ